MLVFPASLPVTVCAPATVAVQTLPLHEPSGETANDVLDVTSPNEFPDESKPSAVNDRDPPATTAALDGLTTM